MQNSTWEVTYTDAQGELRVELIEAYSVETGNQHVVFNAKGKGRVLLLDQRAMHSARNITVLDMSTNTESTTTEAVTD